MLRALGRIAYRIYVAVIIGGVAVVAVLTRCRPVPTAIHTLAFAVPVRPFSGEDPAPAAEPDTKR